MTPKREPYVRPPSAEPGVHHMSDEALEDHHRRMHEGNLRRARREAEGHEKGCKCWPCLFLLQQEPLKGGRP